MNLFWQAVSEDTWKLTLGHSLPNIVSPTVVRRHFTVAALWAKQEIWKSTFSFTLEKNPPTAQNAGSQVLNPPSSILETQWFEVTPRERQKAELKLWTVILVCYLLNRMAPRCKLIASHQLERPAPSCLHLNKGSSFPAPFFNCLILDWIGFTIGYGVSTALSTNFGQPETGPACRFCFCFLDIWKRTIQLKMRVWTTASQDTFVGFNPLTITSGQGYISELIAQHSHFSDDRSSPSSQKMNGECSFLKATQCSEGPVFSTPNQYTKCDIRLWYWRKVPERKNQKESYRNWKVKVWM